MLNYTQLIENSKDNYPDLIKYSSPRFSLGNVIRNKQDQYVNDALILLADLNKEKEMGLGRGFPENMTNLKSNECINSKATADRLNVKEGDVVKLDFWADVLLKNTIIDSYYNASETNNYNFTILKEGLYSIVDNYTIKGIIDDPKGKFSSDQINFAIIEISTFDLSRGINAKLSTSFPGLESKLKSLKLHEMAYEIVVNFPPNRINNYIVKDYNSLKKVIVDYGNKLVINGDNVFSQFPIADEMRPLFFGSVFLGLMLNLSIILIFLLSVLLIYSLLMVTTETSSFDLGIIRLVGSSKYSVIVIIIIQCLTFSIPAFLLAYILHFVVLGVISNLLSGISEAQISLQTTSGAFIYSFLICNLAPIIAAIYPIISLLKKSLITSINTSLSKTSGVKIEIVILSKKRKILFDFIWTTFIYLWHCYILFFTIVLTLSQLDFTAYYILLDIARDDTWIYIAYFKY